jgi:glycosyltransferase involved in cell wall biosynthesis
MSLKIILISPAHPLRGGIAASSERLATAFQAAGHDVTIYSFALQYPAFLFPGKTQFSSGQPPEGLAIKTRINSVNPLNWWAVGREIAREQPDQIVVRFWLPFMGPCLGSILRIARFFSKIKFKTTALVDNIVPHEKRLGDRHFAQWFVWACDDFVVMSKSVGDEIKAFLGKKSGFSETVRYSPHPIYDIYGKSVDKNEARSRLGIPQGVPLVLFFGFVRKYKGLDLLLEALAEPALPYLRQVHVAVAGECYEDWRFYQNIIEEKGLQERSHIFADFIPTEQVAEFFSAADLVVQPYRTATQSGISQIAYHFDKPMVVTDVGGLPEIVRQGVSGYVVPPEPGAIGRAIADFFENGRADVLRAGILAEKQRFSWENLVHTILLK